MRRICSACLEHWASVWAPYGKYSKILCGPSLSCCACSRTMGSSRASLAFALMAAATRRAWFSPASLITSRILLICSLYLHFCTSTTFALAKLAASASTLVAAASANVLFRTLRATPMLRICAFLFLVRPMKFGRCWRSSNTHCFKPRRAIKDKRNPATTKPY
jgi:hypothetical protein